MKTKYKCENCSKSFVHIWKCVDGKERCASCKRNMVTNIWYSPKIKTQDKIGKFSINFTEFKILLRKYLEKGLSYEEAKKKVRFDENKMKSLQKNHYNVLNEKPDLNIKLSEGLGQWAKKKKGKH